MALVHREDETTGTLQITATRPPGAGGVSGQGAVVTLTFQAKASGQTPLTITGGSARPRAAAHHGERSAGVDDRAIRSSRGFHDQDFEMKPGRFHRRQGTRLDGVLPFWS